MRPCPAPIPQLRHRPSVAIAIPARNEADRLPACLAALARQRATLAPDDLAVLILANNCEDATAAAARAMAAALPFRLLVDEVRLPQGAAHAGGARRAAMDAATALLDPAGLLLSTDADACPEPGWLAANRAAVAAGADAVAGQVLPDPAEAAKLPPALRLREAAEARYAALLDEMAALLDPDPHDPWPRHGIHSGASIAVTAAAYRRVGGLPPVPSGEDRALFDTLRRADFRVRHCPEARVLVSCRLDGRAAGGMAEALRRRLAEADTAPVDASLEPALPACRRLRFRRALRHLREGAACLEESRRLARMLGLPVARLQAIAALPGFWRAWDALQLASPLLARWPALSAAALPAETVRAQAILRRLRPGKAGAAAGRAGSAACATAG